MNQQTDYENLDSLKGDNLAYYIGKSAETTRCILKHASIQGDDLKLEYDIVSAVDEEDCLICIAQAALDVCNTTTKFDGIENILIDYNGDTIDRYGNSGKSHIADIVFSKRAISKINYSYFETGIYSSVKSFFDLSEVYYLIPALKNELF